MGNVKFTVPLTKRIIHLNFTVKKELTLNDSCIGIDSGPKKSGWHLCLFDYDKIDPEKEYFEIMKEQGHRRALKVESSPGNFHIADFTKRKWPDYLGIMSKTSCDTKHKWCTMNMGFSTLRVTEKNGVRPKVVKVLENPNGTKFYNYDEENLYKKMIDGEGGFELQRILRKLSNKDKGKTICPTA